MRLVICYDYFLVCHRHNPPPWVCERKKALIESIRDPMEKIIVLNNREIDVVIESQFDELERIEGKLVEAGKRKDILIDDYRKHVRTHGC